MKNNGKQKTSPIIDCDVHHGDMTKELPELFPYLPRHYVEYIKDFGPLLPGLGYTNVPPATNATRHDLWELANSSNGNGVIHKNGRRPE
ncbi:MAG: hypothetical protein AAF629_24945 [Chloroflexota bacterium]